MKRIISYILCFILYFVLGKVMFANIDAGTAVVIMNVLMLVILGLLSYIFFLSDVVNNNARIIVNLFFVILVIVFLFFSDKNERILILIFSFYHARGMLSLNKYIRIYKIILTIPLLLLVFKSHPITSIPLNLAYYLKTIFVGTLGIDLIVYIIMTELKCVKLQDKMKERIND